MLFARSQKSIVLSATCAAIAVALSACSKKEEPKPAPAAAKAAEPAAAAAAAVEAAKPVEPPAAPPPSDVKLEAGDAVVAWLSLRSFATTFDAVELLATKFEAAPPGVSLRQAALDELAKAFASVGIVGHEWIDKTRAIHIVYQDDKPEAPQSGLAVMLPVVDKKKALDAMTSAKKGAEAAGHEAVLQVGTNQLFIDFLDNTAVLTVDGERFAKVKAFAGRISAVEVPAAVYLGVSVGDVVKTRAKELEQAFVSLDAFGKGSAEPGAGASVDYYSKMLREWTQSLTRIEVLVDANTDDIQAAMRLHALPESKLGKQIASSRGRLALPLASQLPANAYMAFVSNVDPAASVDQVRDALKMLGEMFKLDAALVDGLETDLRMAVEKQDGTSGLAVYPDGDAAVGLLAFAGAKDPEAVLKLGKKVISVLLLKAIEMEEAREKAADPKAPADPKLGIVKKAVADMKVDPLIEAFGPVAKEAGVTITANTTKADGAACDVIDFTFDWAKIKASAGGKEAEQVERFTGKTMAAALCTGADRIVLTVGPSAFEQGRRAATGKVGGLDAAPVWKSTADKAVASPVWLAYLNLGAAVGALRKAIPELAGIELPADRAIGISCGLRTSSYACELDVPVSVGHALAKIGKQKAQRQPQPHP